MSRTVTGALTLAFGPPEARVGWAAKQRLREAAAGERSGHQGGTRGEDRGDVRECVSSPPPGDGDGPPLFLEASFASLSSPRSLGSLNLGRHGLCPKPGGHDLGAWTSADPDLVIFCVAVAGFQVLVRLRASARLWRSGCRLWGTTGSGLREQTLGSTRSLRVRERHRQGDAAVCLGPRACPRCSTLDLKPGQARICENRIHKAVPPEAGRTLLRSCPERAGPRFQHFIAGQEQGRVPQTVYSCWELL